MDDHSAEPDDREPTADAREPTADAEPDDREPTAEPDDREPTADAEPDDREPTADAESEDADYEADLGTDPDDSDANADYPDPTPVDEPEPAPPPRRRVCSVPDPPAGAGGACPATRRHWVNVPSRHMRCQTDADCVAVAAGHCRHVALNQRAARSHRYRRAVCAGAGEGACGMPVPRAICEAGCCVADGLGGPGHRRGPR